MAILSKTQLGIDIAASTFTAPQKVILNNMVDSYQDIFPQMDTAARDLLTPTNGQIIYNTDTIRYEYWNGVLWAGIGQDLSTPLVVKVSLTSAELLALDTVPKVLVAAPASGLAIVPVSLAYRFTYGTVAYTGTYNINLKNTTSAITDAFTSLSFNTINAAANRSGSNPANTGTGINAIVEADSIELMATAAIATGDGNLDVWLTYSLINY